MLTRFFTDQLMQAGIASDADQATVRLRNELVPLLSEQLYRSPIKAIEELVVNSYDAKAEECRLFVPAPSELADSDGRHFVVVFDDGDGMDVEAIQNLWHVGRSPKTDGRINQDRKQIGKFGIGKIATYTVANRLTYITKTDTSVHVSTLNFRDLTATKAVPGSQTDESIDDKLSDATNVSPEKESALIIPILRVDDWSKIDAEPLFQKAIDAAGLTADHFAKDSWTLAILEDLKDRASDLKAGRLRWVLQTAMPLRADFQLYLNGGRQ